MRRFGGVRLYGASDLDTLAVSDRVALIVGVVLDLDAERPKRAVRLELSLDFRE